MNTSIYFQLICGGGSLLWRVREVCVGQGKLPTGIYSVSLVINGNIVGNKKMIIIN